MRKLFLLLLSTIFLIILMFSANGTNSQLPADQRFSQTLETLIFEPIPVPYSPNDHPDMIVPYSPVYVKPTPTPKPVVKPKPKPKPTAKPKPKPAPVVRVSSSVRFRWPARGHLSGYFSSRHPAIDIAAPTGTRVVAAAAGKVIFAGWKNNGGGYQVWIAHGKNLYTTYNHMSRISVKTGMSVRSGAIIGRVGATGWATGPHLHFEIWKGRIWGGGYRVNPLRYL